MLTQVERDVIIACLLASKDQPLTREELKIITHKADRVSRDVIGDLREKGYRVAHSSKGYWFALDPQDYAEWAPRYTANAYTILSRKSAMDRWTEGQLEMSESDEWKGIIDEVTKIKAEQLSGY